MTHSRAGLLVVIVAGAVLPLLVSARVCSAQVADLRARLEALRPGAPMAYFELAEEVAYGGYGAEGRELARRLYILAFETSRDGGEEAVQLGQSVCLGLADVSTKASEQRWLYALASSLAPEDDAPDWPVVLVSHASDDESSEIAEVLLEAQIYENSAARRLVRGDDLERILKGVGMDAVDARAVGSRMVVSSNEPSDCPGCRNERVTSERRGSDRDTTLCSRCRGNPGAEYTGKEFVLQLTAQTLLLGGEVRGWSGQEIVTGGRTVRDTDPDELHRRFDVQPDATVWRPTARANDDDAAPDGIPRDEWVEPESENEDPSEDSPEQTDGGSGGAERDAE